ncbi:MAG: head GIN domain-containing protein [Parabacteroides sp.]|nr:head GIN domain-containing protein [Parabacteroides sp.]
MKQISLLLSIILCPSLLCSCNFQTNAIKGDGNIVVKEITIKDYNELDIEVSNMDLIYQQSAEAPFLKIETDQNIMNILTIEQDDDELTIKYPKEQSQTLPSRLTITTNSTKLKEVAIAGSGSCHLGKGITGEELEIILAGKCTVQADSIAVHELDCAIAGNGELRLSGKVYKTEIESAGNSQIDAFGLQTNILECNIAGKSQIEMSVSELISAEIAGKADIFYKGNPQIKKQSLGKGTIKQVK